MFIIYKNVEKNLKNTKYNKKYQGRIHRIETDPWTGGGVIFYIFYGRNQVSVGY